jgi:hypothetical protein
MQEAIEEKTVAISMKGTRLTGRMLAKAMRAFIKMAKSGKKPKQGLQSIKSLNKQGANLSNIEITDKNIGSFKRIARKYGVDFALKRDSSETPPKWMVFFKGKDADTLTAAFKEYSSKMLKQKTRKPSLLEKIGKFKELAKVKAAPVKNRNMGGHEL